MKAGRLTERDGADWEENERQKERCGNLLTQALSKIMGREDVICVAF